MLYKTSADSIVRPEVVLYSLEVKGCESGKTTLDDENWPTWERWRPPVASMLIPKKDRINRLQIFSQDVPAFQSFHRYFVKQFTYL
jgi:hypothetical protein